MPDPHTDTAMQPAPTETTSGDGRGPRRGPRGRGRTFEVRHWLVLVLVAVVTALVIADWGRVPMERIDVGDVAPRTVNAPFTYTYQDLDGWEASRDRAAADTPAVMLHDEAMIPEISQQVGAAFRAARTALPTLANEAGDEPVEPPAPTRDEMQAALSGFIDTLDLDAGVAELMPLARARFPVEAEAVVVGWLEQAYQERYVVTDVEAVPAAPDPLTIVPRVGDRASYVLRDRSRIIEPDDAREAVTFAALKDKLGTPWADAAETIAQELVRADLVLDPARTAAAKEAARASVQPEAIIVQRGETLFREGDKVSASALVRYEALQASRTENGVVFGILSSAAFLLLVLGTGYIAGKRGFGRKQGTRDLLAMGGVIVTVAVLAKVVVASGHGISEQLGNDATAASVWFLVPVAGASMLVRILMGTRKAAYVTVVAASVCGLLMQFDALYVFYFLLTSLVGATSVHHLRERITVVWAGLYTALFGAMVVFSLHFLDLYVGTGELSAATAIRPFWSVLFAFAGGLLSGFFVLAVIPIFEAAGFVTDHRMLELASLNHPLLRQLMLRAPGTYHHSVIVGTLAEAACTRIGANALQAKIAAYFHDVGKARKPRYFVENQRGGHNPHTDLDPSESARIIIDHVIEGDRMAQEHKLPEPILDNIRMHHGTGLLQYFFAKAQMEADDPSEVDEADFRYPGPKPSTREAGVVMLADKVEAATRTIKQPTEENIRAMINRIINSVIADHQFSECPLTFQEIHRIADTFVQVLLGIYHQRIEYPETAGISRGSDHARDPDDAGKLPAVGTITLELEARAMAAGASTSDLWNDDPHEMTDETTDYESVRNLPQGES